jgi:hypothetical protein
MALTTALIIQEGVQSDVLVSMEGVRPNCSDSCIDHVGGSPVGQAGVNEGSPAW